MCFVVLDVLGRLVGFVALERKGVLSGWILRDEGFASKSRIRDRTLEGCTNQCQAAMQTYSRSEIRDRRLAGPYGPDHPLGNLSSALVVCGREGSVLTSVSTSTTTS
jgi:hypothetical protein